jgi:hypothetical protein
LVTACANTRPKIPSGKRRYSAAFSGNRAANTTINGTTQATNFLRFGILLAANLCVIPHVPGKPELPDNDPEKISQLLELQLAQKRAEWKRASARYRMLRSLSFLFLFVVIAGGLFAFSLIFSRVNEVRTSQPNTTTTAVSRR